MKHKHVQQVNHYAIHITCTQCTSTNCILSTYLNYVSAWVSTVEGHCSKLPNWRATTAQNRYQLRALVNTVVKNKDSILPASTKQRQMYGKYKFVLLFYFKIPGNTLGNVQFIVWARTSCIVYNLSLVYVRTNCISKHSHNVTLKYNFTLCSQNWSAYRYKNLKRKLLVTQFWPIAVRVKSQEPDKEIMSSEHVP